MGAAIQWRKGFRVVGVSTSPSSSSSTARFAARSWRSSSDRSVQRRVIEDYGANTMINTGAFAGAFDSWTTEPAL